MDTLVKCAFCQRRGGWRSKTMGKPCPYCRDTKQVTAEVAAKIAQRINPVPTGIRQAALTPTETTAVHRAVVKDWIRFCEGVRTNHPEWVSLTDQDFAKYVLQQPLIEQNAGEYFKLKPKNLTEHEIRAYIFMQQKR